MITEFFQEKVYDNLPPDLAAITRPFQGRERDIVLLSSLVTMSNCFPNVYGIYSRAKYTPHLYGFVIAPPASGKGRVDLSRMLIDPIHNKVVEISSKKVDECKSKNKKNPSGCGPVEVKLLPGNTTSARVYSYLAKNDFGLLILESEADTISNLFKQEWGDFSDVLRKAFHHETVSVSRELDDKFIKVDNPQLAVMLAGTPGQIQPLLKSHENGLFSRFIFYYFTELSDWQDVSPYANVEDYHPPFHRIAQKLFELYTNLRDREPIQIHLTEDQWTDLDTFFRNGYHYHIESNEEDFTSSVKRLGLIFFRLCMILTMLRNIDGLEGKKQLTCADEDYETVKLMVRTLVYHAREVYLLLKKPEGALPALDQKILNSLPKKFTRREAIAVAEELNVATRTMDTKLQNWKKMKMVISPSSGVYVKK